MNDSNTPPDTNKTELNFESAMVELEALVTKIETGNLSLEESLKEFENGIKLSRGCQSALQDAEQRVKILCDDGIGDEDSANSSNDEQDFIISAE